MVEAATFHCGSSSVMTGRRGGRSTVRLPKRTAGSKTEPTVERPSDSADDDGRFLPDICRLGRRPWHRFLYLSHTEGAPRNTARGLPRPPKYSLDTAVTAAYDFHQTAQVACEKPRRFAARGFFISVPGVAMAVLMFRRRPHWVRAAVAVIAFMRLHYADRRDERHCVTTVQAATRSSRRRARQVRWRS